MPKCNPNKWKPSELQLDEIILPIYTYLSKRCVFYIKDLECPQQYIADMLKNYAYAINNSISSSQRK